jgi:hypothetical protein
MISDLLIDLGGGGKFGENLPIPPFLINKRLEIDQQG